MIQILYVYNFIHRNVAQTITETQTDANQEQNKGAETPS